MEYDATVMARLYDAGWSRYGWPAEVGGFGGDVLHRAIFYDALAAARLPIPAQRWTLEVLGPSLVLFAPHLAAEFLPRYLRGQEWWGQGFSEPGGRQRLGQSANPRNAGRVRRLRHQWAEDLDQPRTDRVAPSGAGRHRWCGKPSPRAHHAAGRRRFAGVTIRPIALASGRREVAEIFFDDVQVGPDRVVGSVDGGWAVVMYLMQFERGVYGYAVLTRRSPNWPCCVAR